MTASFNLTEEAWIPCELPDGATTELSTRDALLRAHELRAITDESPLVVAVLHRHLLAVLHRAYIGPSTMKEWAVIARSARFDAGRLEAYLSRVHDRMDLFHPVHPFAQTRGLIARGMRVTPIEQLEVERSGWGQARALFQHRPTDNRLTMSPARALRALLVQHAFAMHGNLRNPAEGKRFGESHSASAGPLVHSAVVLLRGDSLFATLLANLLRYNPALSLPVPSMGEDKPSWEQEPLPSTLRDPKEPRRAPAGWLDALTWQSRRIELETQGEAVTGFARGLGYGLAGEPAFLDPMVTYRVNPEKGYMPIGMDLERAFWRDANALFEAAGRDQAGASRPAYRRPVTVDSICSPIAREVLATEAVYSIDVMGMHAKRGVETGVQAVRLETVSVKARLLAEPDVREAVTEVLATCEESIRCMLSALREYGTHVLGPAGRGDVEKRRHIEELVQSTGAEAATWSALGVRFAKFVNELGSDVAIARLQFARELRRIIQGQFHDAVSSSSGSGRGLKARAIATRQLDEGLNKLVPLEATDVVVREVP